MMSRSEQEHSAKPEKRHVADNVSDRGQNDTPGEGGIDFHSSQR